MSEPEQPTDDLAASYAGAFDGRLGFGARPALLLIDLVAAYFVADSPLYADVDDALASALRLRAAARAAGIPRILTNVVHHPGGADGGMFRRKVPALEVFESGHPLGAWAPGLAPESDEMVLSKQYASAFFGTSLASTLTALGVDTLILAGLTTSGCVRATCIDTISSGFIPIVVREACGDRHPGPHEANLFDMDAKYGDVCTEGDVIAWLQRRASS